MSQPSENENPHGYPKSWGEKEIQDFHDSLIRDNERLMAEMQEQEEREKLDPPDRVRIDLDTIFWRVVTQEIWLKGERYPFIELLWGWTTGADGNMKPPERGLILSRQFALELRDNLTKWLDTQEPQ